MKQLILIIFLTCSSLLYGQTISEKVVLNLNSNSLNLLSASEEGLRINLQVGNFYKKSVEINGVKYFAVNLIEESAIKEKGNPELPKFTRSIMIPGTSDFAAKIISSKYEDISLPIIPSKGILSRIINPDDVPYSFSSLYTKDSFYPMDRFSFDEPYLIRDSRGVALNIYPFAYNPVKKILRIYTNIELEITFTGSNLKNSTQRSDIKANKYFEPMLSNHFLNYQAVSSLKSTRTVEENGRMLIISHNDFINAMQPFVNHKNNRGLNTEIVSMNDVGITAAQVRTYIQNRYNSDNSITFVLLVGDHSQVPTLMVNGGGSDPSFSLVSGSDNYPDIIIGRFSAENVNQVETMVTRSLFYENMTEQEWFHSGMGIASSEGTGDDNEYDYEHLRNIRTGLLGWHYNQIGEFYEGSQGGADPNGEPTVAQISNSINSGSSIINFTGHGSNTSWGWFAPNWVDIYSNNNVNSLTNDDRLPFVFSVACVVGNFTSTTCFAESWLRASNSSTNRPTGAIGFYGSSINQDWQPPMQAQDRFNELLINEDYITFGGLCYNASWSMMDEYGSGAEQSGTNMFLAWHIFGDPSINVIPHVQGDCQDNITISETINGGTHEFLASNSISASNQISNGASAHYGANGSITLLPGFSVASGCTFTADVNGCNRGLLKSAKVADFNNSFSSEYNVSEKEKNLLLFPAIDQKEPIIKVFPNPISDGSVKIEISNTDMLNSVSIYNSMGKLIYTNKTPNNILSIDNINEKGLLVIKIELKDSIIVKKIISE